LGYINVHGGALKMKDFSVRNRLREIYNGYCEGESAWCWLGAIDKADNIVALCKDYPHSTILEIGAGEGSILKRLSDLKFGDMLYAMELTEKAFDLVRERKIESLIECKVFDGYAIPYEENKFDLAILSHVLEHVEYPRKLLYEAARVAKYIFVEVPLEDNFRLPRDFVFDKVGHINSYSPKTIRRLAQSCDLEVLRQIVTNPSLRIYEYQYGRMGAFKYLVKELMLRVIPAVALLAWTYHSAIICQRNQ
jgi:ubiquinone/menaquinone biosynthesis C-methylase UbiE